uniref:Protein white n=1 Tax=Magallana gigas TaxID=29159 RepID=K1QMC2_MAGGI
MTFNCFLLLVDDINPECASQIQFDREANVRLGGVRVEMIDPELGFPQKDYEENYSSQVYPVTLSWRDCNVFALPKRKLCCLCNKEEELPKRILTNVSGIIKPGRLTAVMGASGAGKSTLMNMLTFKNRGSLLIQGEIRVNGVLMDKDKMSNLAAYVQQDDLFIGTMTVREHLVFRLGLTKCADTFIGTPGKVKGISGGEMKRLSFASELITNPPLLFTDEVTSGLDSFMALSVVQSLKTMVHMGHTIMCTVHQPSSEVFELFDEIILMAEGKVAFSGPVTHALEFFKSVGHPCPMNYNPANHFILTLAIIPGFESECKGRVEKMCEHYDNSQASKKLEYFETNQDPYERRMSQKLIFALFMGLVYLKTNNDYIQEDIMNINGVIFLLIISFTYNNLFPILNVPFLIADTAILIAIVYWMSGLTHDSYTFINAAIISVLASAAASSFGYAISAASPSVTIALTLGPLLMTPFLLFGGYFLNNGSVPDYFIWIKYTSWFLYSNELMIVNQWRDINHISCDEANSTVCIHNGKDVIQSLNYDENNFVLDLTMLSSLIVLYRFLAFIILLVKTKLSKC